MPHIPLSQQIEVLLKFLRGLEKNGDHTSLREQVLSWVRDIPDASRPRELLDLLHARFNLPADALATALARTSKIPFEVLVPSAGWLHDYIQYTSLTEPPTVFHFFAGMVAIGASLQRNVFFDMGPYQIFPNMSVVIVAPSGKCRKTSACNIAMGLLRATGGNVLADKITPEALVSAFQDRSSAVGVVYAPELAVFLGKQRYNEGMVPLLTSLLDCPREWTSATIMRGESRLTNVALSFLVCSTMDWIQTAIPRDAFGGGFMSRLLFVVQNDTDRSFPIPPPLDKTLEHSLKTRLLAYQRIRGQFTLTDEALAWFTSWYNRNPSAVEGEKQFAGYLERKPDQLKRLAMILHVSEYDDNKLIKLVLTKEHLLSALHVIEWIESFLPGAFEQLSQTNVGEEHARLLKQLRTRGGQLDHSTWLRMNSTKMNALQFKHSIETLRLAKLVERDQNTGKYYLTPEGWKT